MKGWPDTGNYYYYPLRQATLLKQEDLTRNYYYSYYVDSEMAIYHTS